MGSYADEPFSPYTPRTYTSISSWDGRSCCRTTPRISPSTPSPSSTYMRSATCSERGVSALRQAGYCISRRDLRTAGTNAPSLCYSLILNELRAEIKHRFAQISVASSNDAMAVSGTASMDPSSTNQFGVDTAPDLNYEPVDDFDPGLWSR
jgi:hypothetical protein